MEEGPLQESPSTMPDRVLQTIHNSSLSWKLQYNNKSHSSAPLPIRADECAEEEKINAAVRCSKIGSVELSKTWEKIRLSCREDEIGRGVVVERA